MSETDSRDFQKIREKAEAFYKTIGEMYCPFFSEKVIFNTKGMEHLKFKGKNRARSRLDQKMRFKLLKTAVEIVSLSKTVQGISEQKIFELNRSNHRNEYLLTDVIFYEFVAVIRGVRARVIIKQIGPAQKYFWSVIPFWKFNNKTGKRVMNYGNPEDLYKQKTPLSRCPLSAPGYGLDKH